jgi:hypothetical protein
VTNLRKQPEGASRQAVGVLIGALLGFGITARQIFSDYAESGDVPWVTCVAGTMIGAVVGLILATLLGAGQDDEEQPAPPIPPDAEGKAPVEPRNVPLEPGHEGPEEHVKPAEGVEGLKPAESVEGVRRPDGHGQTG